MGSNLPTVKRSCETCMCPAHGHIDHARKYAGVVMMDRATGRFLCGDCWATHPRPDRHAPDHPNNRIR